ncbi:MAG: AIPR family protein [Luteolibacter sp.]
MTLEDYFQEFTQELVAQAGADENFTRSSFIEHMCSSLEDEGFMTGYAQTDYKNTTKGLGVDAWSYDNELACLTLILGDYRDSGSLETLTKTDIEKAFKRLVKFVESSLTKGFAESLDEAMPATELAWMIRKSRNEIARISLVLVSNATLSTKVAALPKDQAGDFTTSYEVWDLGRIHRANTSGKAREDIWIDFSSEGGGALPCLPAYLGDGSMQSYLLVIPGNVLADLYQSYGERLLEQNVRTFLQFRGNINKGIRNTIANEPHMFFSYNNGLAATAEEVVTAEGNRQILKIKNLQVVNGGQTTASIFTARRKEKLDLDNVYVQVKLSIVPPAKVEEIVPRISQYSNTQNKVNAADFFSNHPFHLRVEEFSRRLWAPSAVGQVQETHWFYERARGQYANQQANLTPAQQKKFLLMNPRSQMFTKTDLCKFILTFDEVPNEVSLGAQKAFAGSPRNPGFVGRIAKEWEEHEGKSFNELWFKNAIAKAIFFRQVDKLVFRQDWYGGYKANIVTYALAKFAAMVRESGNYFDFLRIWNLQGLPDPLEFKLMEIAETVNEILVNPPDGATSNVTEWAKKSDCWELVKASPLKLGGGFPEYLINHQVVSEREHEGGRTQTIQDSIHAQTYVVEKGALHWKQLREWNSLNKKLSPKEMGILETACSIPRGIPSDKQAPILVAAEKRAIENGFYPQS